MPRAYSVGQVGISTAYQGAYLAVSLAEGAVKVALT
jgi:hypothetical protein